MSNNSSSYSLIQYSKDTCKCFLFLYVDSKEGQLFSKIKVEQFFVLSTKMSREVLYNDMKLQIK